MMYIYIELYWTIMNYIVCFFNRYILNQRSAAPRLEMLTSKGLEVEAGEAPNDAEAKLLGLKFTDR